MDLNLDWLIRESGRSPYRFKGYCKAGLAIFFASLPLFFAMDQEGVWFCIGLGGLEFLLSLFDFQKARRARVLEEGLDLGK